MRDWLGTNPCPLPLGPATDRQELAGVLLCHVLHSLTPEGLLALSPGGC